MTERPALVVSPERSRVDEAIHVRVSGLPPGREIAIRVTAVDGALKSWEARGTYTADAAGVVELEGDEAGGLLEAMRPAEAGAEIFFTRRAARPVRVVFEVAAEGGPASGPVGIERDFGGPEVGARTVDDREIIGTLFHPVTPEVRPGVLLLGGSDGGELDHAASLLAAHGYAVLALAYFGVEDRPPNLLEIDLEYFDAALAWLGAQPEADPERLAIIGLSRGGELALQIAALRPDVKAVVAGSPSSVRHAGMENYTNFKKAAWRRDGQDLPYVPGKFTFGTFADYFAVWALHRPLRQRKTFERALRDQDVVRAATIPVEDIRGPVLLISGTDDQLWPSHRFATEIMERLRAHDHPHPDEHLVYEGAGHFLCYPYGLPSLPPMTRMSPLSRLTIDFGGTPEANARAARDSWPRVLRFLAALG